MSKAKDRELETGIGIGLTVGADQHGLPVAEGTYIYTAGESTWVAPSVGVYMCPMPGDASDAPVITSTTTLYMAQMVDYERDLSMVPDADLVAEILRRVLSGKLMPRSRELLELALDRCK